MKGIEEILIFSHVCLVERMESGGIENSFVWLEKKNKGTENVICRNLLSCPHYIYIQHFFYILLYYPQTYKYIYKHINLFLFNYSILKKCFRKITQIISYKKKEVLRP